MLAVRPVAADDPALAALLATAPDELTAPVPDRPAPGRSLLLLAVRDEVPVGCCTVRAAGPGVAALDALRVRPDDRGAARALLASAERFARQLGAAEVRLATEHAGTVEVAGYRPVRAEPGWYRKVLGR